MPAPTITSINRSPGQPAYLNGRAISVYLDALARPSA